MRDKNHDDDDATVTTCGINVDGFGFTHDGLDDQMRRAKGGTDGGREGVVVSHAGM